MTSLRETKEPGLLFDVNGKLIQLSYAEAVELIRRTEAHGGPDATSVARKMREYLCSPEVSA